MRAIDHMASTSRLARVSATEKALFALGSLLLAAALPPWPASAAVLVIVQIGLWAVARVRVTDYLKTVGAPFLFLLVSIAPLLVSVSTAGPGLVRLAFTTESLPIAGEVALRVVACLHCLLFLTLTTPTPQLLLLMRRCRVPAVVTEISLLLYRYVWLLLATLESLYRAQTARLGYSTVRSSYRSAALLAVSLLGHTLHRAQQLERSLESRNWQGSLHVIGNEEPTNHFRLAGIGVLQASILISTLIYNLT